MIRGPKIFKCDNCKKIFVGMDIELGATVFSVPLKCPRCSSMHTKPLFESKGLYSKVWEQIGNNQQVKNNTTR